MRTRSDMTTTGLAGITRDSKPLRRAWAVLPILAASLIAGCGGGGGAGPIEPDKARGALKTVLESWKNGDKIEQVKAGSPPIVAQDFDWMSGSKLVAYEVEGDGKENDVNLRVPVKLTLKTAQGKEVKKTVTYVIGTNPALTVFREF